MIKQINTGTGLIVTGSSSNSYIAKSYSSNATHMVGSVMYDLDMQSFKIYDGSMWQNYNMSHPTIEFDAETKALLEWAKKKRKEEIERDLLAHTNPTIKNLIHQIEEKEDQILMVQTLLKNSGDESKLKVST